MANVMPKMNWPPTEMTTYTREFLMIREMSVSLKSFLKLSRPLKWIFDTWVSL